MNFVKCRWLVFHLQKLMGELCIVLWVRGPWTLRMTISLRWLLIPTGRVAIWPCNLMSTTSAKRGHCNFSSNQKFLLCVILSQLRNSLFIRDQKFNPKRSDDANNFCLMGVLWACEKELTFSSGKVTKEGILLIICNFTCTDDSCSVSVSASSSVAIYGGTCVRIAIVCSWFSHLSQKSNRARVQLPLHAPREFRHVQER